MKKLILNSAIAQSGTKNTPTFRFLQGIQMSGIRLNSVILPLSFYNIDDKNNKVVFSDGGNTRVAYLPPGQYSGSVLSDKLEAIMTAAGTQSYSVDFIVPQMKLKVTAPGQFKMLVDGSNSNDVLGLVANSAPATSFTFDKPVDLTGTQLILLSIPQITSDAVVYSGRENLNILEAIPVTQDLGTVQVYQNHAQEFIDTMDQTISEVTIRLLDNGNLLDLDLQGDSFQIVFDII
jgi:hypothetical protein